MLKSLAVALALSLAAAGAANACCACCADKADHACCQDGHKDGAAPQEHKH